MGRDPKPKQWRPAVVLNTDHLPVLDGVAFSEVWILSPNDLPGYRPEIGAEVPVGKVTAWQVSQVIFEPLSGCRWKNEMSTHSISAAVPSGCPGTWVEQILTRFPFQRSQCVDQPVLRTFEHGPARSAADMPYAFTNFPCSGRLWNRVSCPTPVPP